MTSIYLIRHAEAEGNLFRRAQGHWNGKITARGKLQIDALAERFKDVRIDAVYSSDLDRAVETAGAILRGRDVPFKRTPLLREINMGVWEGQPWGNITYRWPEQMYLFNNEPERWHVPGCESFDAVQSRMRDCMYELAAEHEGGTIAAVSHGMAIRRFLTEFPEKAGEVTDFIGNCGVLEMTYADGKLTVEKIIDPNGYPKGAG